jgi:hypothetical protein
MRAATMQYDERVGWAGNKGLTDSDAALRRKDVNAASKPCERPKA